MTASHAATKFFPGQWDDQLIALWKYGNLHIQFQWVCQFHLSSISYRWWWALGMVSYCYWVFSFLPLSISYLSHTPEKKINLPSLLSSGSILFCIHQSWHLTHTVSVSLSQVWVRSSHGSFSVKEVFLEISQNPPKNTCARVSFWIKLLAEACHFILKKRLWHRCFPVNCCEISKNA